jgi:regulator of RNase E activity RraA
MTGPAAPTAGPIAEATRRRLLAASTATLTSQLLRRGFRTTFLHGLRPTRPDLRMVGRAFTLRYAPSREDVGFEVDYDNARNLQRIAVEMAPAGSVLVIDARGDEGAASFGHILATRLGVRGLAGLVTDGGLRDSPSFATVDLPAFFRSAHATTSSVRHWPVDLQVPVGCAGVLVIPGDVVVGDAEGVVVIPGALADEVAEGAEAQEEAEIWALDRIREGEALPGIYPLGPDRSAEFEAWRDARRPDAGG